MTNDVVQMIGWAKDDPALHGILWCLGFIAGLLAILIFLHATGRIWLFWFVWGLVGAVGVQAASYNVYFSAPSPLSGTLVGWGISGNQNMTPEWSPGSGIYGPPYYITVSPSSSPQTFYMQWGENTPSGYVLHGYPLGVPWFTVPANTSTNATFGLPVNYGIQSNLQNVSFTMVGTNALGQMNYSVTNVPYVYQLYDGQSWMTLTNTSGIASLIPKQIALTTDAAGNPLSTMSVTNWSVNGGTLKLNYGTMTIETAGQALYVKMTGNSLASYGSLTAVQQSLYEDMAGSTYSATAQQTGGGGYVGGGLVITNGVLVSAPAAYAGTNGQSVTYFGTTNQVQASAQAVLNGARDLPATSAVNIGNVSAIGQAVAAGVAQALQSANLATNENSSGSSGASTNSSGAWTNVVPWSAGTDSPSTNFTDTVFNSGGLIDQTVGTGADTSSSATGFKGVQLNGLPTSIGTVSSVSLGTFMICGQSVTLEMDFTQWSGIVSITRAALLIGLVVSGYFAAMSIIEKGIA